jgi:diacylglycerol kinase family enzyme
VVHAYGLRSGGIEGQEGVVTASGRRIEIEGAEGFNVDGEVLDDRDLTFTVEPAAYRVVVGR